MSVLIQIGQIVCILLLTWAWGYSCGNGRGYNRGFDDGKSFPKI